MDAPLLDGCQRASQSESRPRIWIVDDDAAVRIALSRLLRATALEVEVFASAEACLERLEREQPRCLVMDLALPEISGLDLLHLLHTRGAVVPVVFVSGEADVASSVTAMKNGAVDFLEKPVDPDAFLSAVMRALAQEAEWRIARERREQACRLIARLTPRETQVMRQVARGSSNKEIASDLGTSEKTVKVHRGRVMQKLGVRSAIDLFHLTARASGLAVD